MRDEENPRDAPRHRLSHDAQQRIAARTIFQALGGVLLLVVAVFTLTGRCAENPNALRRLQAPVQAKKVDWLRISLHVDKLTIPFLLSVPLAEAKDGEALPEGLLINGLEELPVGVRRTPDGFIVPMTWLGGTLQAVWDGDERVTGEWRRVEADGEVRKVSFSGYRIPDALPERRYAVAPTLPEAQPVRQPLPTRFAVIFKGQTGVLRYRTSTTHAIDATLYVDGKSFGGLAGSLHGRLLQASHFDGREATLLQATINTLGSEVTGFLAVNGEITSFRGTRLLERASIPSHIALTPSEVAKLAPAETKSAIILHTSTLRASGHRITPGLVELLTVVETPPTLTVYMYEPSEGFQERAASWLSHYGINAEVLRRDTDDAHRPLLDTIEFVDKAGHRVAAFHGNHGPDTGGSYRKQMKAWAELITTLVTTPVTAAAILNSDSTDQTQKADTREVDTH